MLSLFGQIFYRPALSIQLLPCATRKDRRNADSYRSSAFRYKTLFSQPDWKLNLEISAILLVPVTTRIVELKTGQICNISMKLQ